MSETITEDISEKDEDISEISETDAVVFSIKWYGISFAILFLLYIIVQPRPPLPYYKNSKKARQNSIHLLLMKITRHFNGYGVFLSTRMMKYSNTGVWMK